MGAGLLIDDREVGGVSTRLLYGELRTGKITGTLDATSASWEETTNDAGSIDGVTVTEDVVRAKDLRQSAAAARCFLAIEQDGRIREGGPIWTYDWDWRKGRLTLGAAGLWSLWDYRFVLPLLEASQRVQEATSTLTSSDLGGIARDLIAQAIAWTGGDVPVVLPDPRPGSDHTETFPGYKLLRVGDQLRELTKREVGAPEIAFRPERDPADPTRIRWVMKVGTAERPQLSQVGADWRLDATPQRSPILGIGVKGNATGMGERAWLTGNGTEQGTLMATAYDPTLLARGYPLMEVTDSRPSVEVQETLDGHAQTELQQSARPIEVWQIAMRADGVQEMRAGDYARVITKGDAFLADGERRVRIKKLSGTLKETVNVDVYPLQAAV